MKHQHFFEEKEGETIMKDDFDYDAPLGILGQLADVLFLKKYMEALLTERNETIKTFAETDRWKELLQS